MAWPTFELNDTRQQMNASLLIYTLLDMGGRRVIEVCRFFRNQCWKNERCMFVAIDD